MYETWTSKGTQIFGPASWKKTQSLLAVYSELTGLIRARREWSGSTSSQTDPC